MSASRFSRHDARAMNELLDGAVELVREWTRRSRNRDNRVFPVAEGRSLMETIHEPLPARGLAPARILSELKRKILPFMRDNGSPRFFGYVMSPPSAPGVVADLITSALDQNVTAWRSAPGATELERLVVSWMARIAGMPASTGGLLTSGGSMATLTALTVARDAKAPAGIGRSGLYALGGHRMMLYASDEIHMSIPRAAQILGLGTDSVRTIPTTARYTIDTVALERAIMADRKSGHLPFCVVASAGTVNTGAIDPLSRVAAIARRHRLWMHVDAAYGGPIRLSHDDRRSLAGLGRADSVALDPHKWLYAPLDVGCVLFADATAPTRAFALHGEYAALLAPGDRESHMFFDSGPELSRRMRALKVWLILKYHGAERIGERIAEEIRLARHLGRLVKECPETELLAPVTTSIVCFRYVPAGGPCPEDQLETLNRKLLLSLQGDGVVYLSNARVKGRFALRACLVNFRTTRADLGTVVREVVRQGRRHS